MECLPGLGLKKKWGYAGTADFLSAFGGLRDASELDYEQYVGLWLNAPRMMARQAFAVLQGVGYAFSDEGIPAAIFEAVTGSHEEAEDLAATANSQRYFQKVLRDTKR